MRVELEGNAHLTVALPPLKRTTTDQLTLTDIMLAYLQLVAIAFNSYAWPALKSELISTSQIKKQLISV